MRPRLFDLLAAVLLLGSLAFSGLCASALARHDYFAAALLAALAIAVLHVGLELCRLSLGERS